MNCTFALTSENPSAMINARIVLIMPRTGVSFDNVRSWDSLCLASRRTPREPKVARCRVPEANGFGTKILSYFSRLTPAGTIVGRLLKGMFPAGHQQTCSLW